MVSHGRPHGGLTIPAALAASAHHHPASGLGTWIGQLPEVVPALAERWALRLGEPYEPGGVCSWVAPATDAAGRALVLKVGWRHHEAVHEAAALQLWDGHAAVRLHASCEDDLTCALLLERCVPGTPLSRLRPEPEQDNVVAGLLRRLWRSPPADHPFRHLATMCAFWTDEFMTAYDRSPARLDPGLVRAGIALFRELPATADHEVVLATDMHAGNILAAEREPWLMIDPKPFIGDPTYDALQHMLNLERLHTDPVTLASRMATLLDLNPDRLALWLFARCVQGCLYDPTLIDVAARLAPR